MAIERFHPGDYGPKTVEGAAFPEVDETALNDIAVGLMALGDSLDGELIPHHAHQRMELADWQGEAGRLAVDAAGGVLGSYGDACAAVYAAARKVFRAESAVVQTKHAVNQTAENTEKVCQIFAKAALQMITASSVAAQSGDAAGANAFIKSAMAFLNLVKTLTAAGLAENTAAVAACATGLANELGVPPGTPGADGEMPKPPPWQSQVPGAPGVPSAPGLQGGAPAPTTSLGGGGESSGSGLTQPAGGSGTNSPSNSLGGGADSVGSGRVQPAGGPPKDAPSKPLGGGADSAGAGAPQQIVPAGVKTPPTADATPAAGAPSNSPAGGPLMAMGPRPSASGTSPSGSPSTSPTATASAASATTPSGTPGGPGTGQPGTGQPTGQQALDTPKNPFGQLPNAQPLSAATNAAPLTTPEQAAPTGTGSGTPTAAGGGAATGTGGAGAAPVSQASASTTAAPTGTPAGAAPAAPLGPAPTPPPAAPVAQPGAGAGGAGTGPGVAPMSANQQQNAAAAAPIPVTPARAERDAMAAAARAGLVRKSAGDADVQFAERIAAALHAPPSIPPMAWNFVWAVGVTSDGEIIAANSYGVSFIPDGMCLPTQVIFVSADESIPAGQRGRWVREPIVALQAWCAFYDKTL